MRLLDRYLLREFLVPLGYCLSGFLIFWIAFDLFSEIHGMQQKHLLARDIAEYYVFKAPEFLILVLPVALLLALLYTLTNHARFNELTAIRAAGISLSRMCLPYFAVGIVASLALFGLNEFLVPRTADIADRILESRARRHLSAEERQEIKNLAFSNSKAGRFWHAGVYNQRSGEMFNVEVQWQQPDGWWRSIFADRALRTNRVWTFYNVREYKQTGTNSLPVRLPQADVVEFPEFSETRAMIQSEINVSDALSIHNTRRADLPIREILNYFRLHPHPERSVRAYLGTKLQGRLAGPWACLVVVLVAIPFASAPAGEMLSLASPPAFSSVSPTSCCSNLDLPLVPLDSFRRGSRHGCPTSFSAPEVLLCWRESVDCKRSKV